MQPVKHGAEESIQGVDSNPTTDANTARRGGSFRVVRRISKLVLSMYPTCWQVQWSRWFVVSFLGGPPGSSSKLWMVRATLLCRLQWVLVGSPRWTLVSSPRWTLVGRPQ